MNITADTLKEGLHDVVTDIEELLKATEGQTSEHLAAARQRVKATLRQVRRKSGDLGLEVAYRARRAATDADHYIHGHPWTTIVIAAGVGALIGYVMGRR